MVPAGGRSSGKKLQRMARMVQTVVHGVQKIPQVHFKKTQKGRKSKKELLDVQKGHKVRQKVRERTTRI